jgi:hypothetical protein
MPSSSITAVLADNALVVSFLSGDAPRVWRIDMKQFMSAALQIEENQGRFILTMKSGSGHAEEIGVFTDRKKAVEALETITEALLMGKAAVPAKKSGVWGKRILKTVLVVLVLLVAITVFGKHRMQTMPRDAAEVPPAQSGVPLPADQILGK